VLVHDTNLHGTEKDAIIWRWAPKGEYSAALAYKVQFQGSYNHFQHKAIWKAKAEPKIQFFAWTASHEKILTVDNLAARGLQHNLICPLCRTQPETPQHLLTRCSFKREVLQTIWPWFSFAGSPPQSPHVDRVATWLAHHMAAANGHDTRKVAGILLYFWWNVWKEQNRRVFENVQQNEFQVASMTNEDVELYWTVRNNIS
jgi:hypothetical protein